MLYHVGDSQHTPNVQINKVIGENEKHVFLFYRKNSTDFLANPIYGFRSMQLPSLLLTSTNSPFIFLIHQKVVDE